MDDVKTQCLLSCVCVCACLCLCVRLSVYVGWWLWWWWWWLHSLLIAMFHEGGLVLVARMHASPRIPVESFSSSSWPRRTGPLKVEHLGSPRSRTLPFFVLKLTHSFTDCSVLHAKRRPTAQCFMRTWSSVYAPRNCCPSGSAALAFLPAVLRRSSTFRHMSVGAHQHVPPWSVADTNVVPTYTEITWRGLL